MRRALTSHTSRKRAPSRNTWRTSSAAPVRATPASWSINAVEASWSNTVRASAPSTCTAPQTRGAPCCGVRAEQHQAAIAQKTKLHQCHRHRIEQSLQAHIGGQGQRPLATRWQQGGQHFHGFHKPSPPRPGGPIVCMLRIWAHMAASMTKPSQDTKHLLQTQPPEIPEWLIVTIAPANPAPIAMAMAIRCQGARDRNNLRHLARTGRSPWAARQTP